ncbi:GntR family transcriptional regulator [Phreatobacter stygius]|uniref:GntR family transcriptional regulator n=1 Tax=Phreatobacter stygius TaxID=1940610 RepID=A0A4D7B846_9HYPH|nr:GntR family transcriptional regulator [Phreatobacter stygius]QCI67023.1 GntR family transcriptional regulator [Phreatobacter stygius]
MLKRGHMAREAGQIRGGVQSSRSSPERVSLKQAAYDEIKRLIVTLKLRPGERINEQVISDLIGIGKTPVHQALQMLSAQGFVEIVPRKGIIITPDSLNDALTVLEARIVIETEMARFAAQRADTTVVEALERILSGGRRALDAEDFDAFMRHDRMFHEKIAEAAGNAILLETLGALHARISRIWHLRSWKLDNLQKTQEEHTAVFRALAARNASGAADAMRLHIETLRQNIVDASIAAGDLAFTP